MNNNALKYSILIIDDEDIMRNALNDSLKNLGYNVYAVENATNALKELENKKFEIVITDLKLPDMSGIDLLIQILKKYPNTCVLVMTAYGSIETAVTAMKNGAFDYITKPFSIDEIIIHIEKMSEKLDLILENEKLKTEIESLKERKGLDNIIGKSTKMLQVFDLIEKAAPSNATVIIYGESGTGKELVASALHYKSNRANKPFIKLNCAALPETLLESELFGYEKGAFTGATTKKIGKFESANEGTIFLDEIGDIALEIQVKLLRVIQEKEFMRVGGVTPIKVDVRIVCATNVNLIEKVREGKFREDLYYRLNVIPIYVPPLRERKEDIPLLVKHFIAKFNKENNKNFTKVSDDVLKLFFNYDWPGNVRQLENIIERIIVLNNGDIITMDMITLDMMKEFKMTSTYYQTFKEVSDIDKNILINQENNTNTANSLTNITSDDILYVPSLASLEEVEKAHIIRALRKLKWNLSKTAKTLNIDRKTLYLKIEKYGLKKESVLNNNIGNN